MRAICGVALAGVVLAGCGGGASPDTAGSDASRLPYGAPAGAPAAQSTPAGQAGQASQAAGSLRLGDQLYTDRGTTDVTGKPDVAITLGTTSFSPTFLRGAPGQSLTLKVTNPTGLPHTLTLTSQSIDQAIPANGQAEVAVTFPASGVARFFCRLHEGSGMNGQLLVGNAQPQPVTERPAAPAPGSDYGY